MLLPHRAMASAVPLDKLADQLGGQGPPLEHVHRMRAGRHHRHSVPPDPLSHTAQRLPGASALSAAV